MREHTEPGVLLADVDWERRMWSSPAGFTHARILSIPRIHRTFATRAWSASVRQGSGGLRPRDHADSQAERAVRRSA